MKYKVGDKVRIKSLDWYNKNKDEFGRVPCGYHTFTEEMSKYCGQIMIICKRTNLGVMHMESMSNYWTDEMIEGIVEDETKPEPKFKVGDKIKLKSSLNNNIFDVIGYESEGYRITNVSNGLTYFVSYFNEHKYELMEDETKPEPKFKVGDKVQIKSLDWYNKNKDGYGIVELSTCIFTPEMSQFCGKIMTIEDVFEDIDDNTIYHMVDVIDYDWTDEMIEGLVEEEEFIDKACKWLMKNVADYVYRYEDIDYHEMVKDFRKDMEENNNDMIELLMKEKSKYETASYAVKPKPNAYCITRERVDELPVHELATKIDKELPSGNHNVWELPDGYQFEDENGNVINATKIVLEKKKKEYPKTYEECCKVLDFCGEYFFTTYEEGIHLPENDNIVKIHQILKYASILTKLLICRNAYWKIAGEEMRLGKPWEPDWLDDDTKKYVITSSKVFETFGGLGYINYILTFPTAEMRDNFKENFKELIEQCKELL